MTQYRSLTPEENVAYTISISNIYQELPFIWNYMSKITPITVSSVHDRQVFFIDPFGRMCVPFYRTDDGDLVCYVNSVNIFHHIMHFLQKSFFLVEDEMISSSNLGYNPQTYVDGFCLAINDCLLSTARALNSHSKLCIKLPENAFTPSHLRLPRGLTVNGYVTRLLDTASLSDPRDNEYELRCTFAVFSPQELSEIDRICPRSSNADIEDARMDLKLELLQFLHKNDASKDNENTPNNSSRECGTEPGCSADKIVIDFLHGKSSHTQWQNVLAAKMAHTKIPPWAAPHSDWSRRNRYNPSECILPGSSDRTCDVLIGVDTSGSMSDLLPYALAEVEKIIKETKVSVKFFSVDTEVSAITMVNSIHDIDLHGSGGTDMRKAYEYASNIDADLFILLTDGETLYPDSNPCRYAVVTALLHDSNSKPEKDCYPTFGDVLEIPVE